jgi:hypothetical protein
VEGCDDGSNHNEWDLIVLLVWAAEEIDVLGVRSTGGAGKDGIPNTLLADIAAEQAQRY